MNTNPRIHNIILDLRCLQDQNYARRGVGRHALALLRHAPRGTGGVRLVGIVDPALPQLPEEARDAVNFIRPNAYAAAAGSPPQPPACFVELSPMTHDPLFVARLLHDPTVLRTTVVYDFIPRHFPDRYLPGPEQRLSYATALRWLAHYDLFASISRCSADELAAFLGVPESAIAVTGCPIDPVFEAVPAMARGLPPRHLLVIGGGDPRKNPEVVIRAHARSPAMQHGAGIPLVVAGSYQGGDARAFRAIAAAAGGRPELIEVSGHVPEAALLELCGRALAIICPSEDEGFSIPVIEGMAAALPCLASDMPAHAELVTDPDCRFPTHDDAVLRTKLERVVADAGWRAAILARQADVWPRFRAKVVAGRFWDAVLRRLDNRAPAVLRGHRPRVALLSPLPPDPSGVADYTAATCVEFGKLVDLHVFSETQRPTPLPHVASIRPLSALPILSAGFDRVVTVVGNSEFHARIFDLQLRYGGACIAHDARLLGFYRGILGAERSLAVASKELGRPVNEDELNAWLSDEGKLEALFLGEIAETAAPTIVHSLITARMFRERYAVTPAYLPFSMHRPWLPEDLTPERRAAARARLGLEQGEVVIVTFGFVNRSKAPEEIVWALDVLRRWGIPASLHFVGALELDAYAPGLRPLVAELGLERQVRIPQGFVSERRYRDYLVGADLGVQLRTYGLGGLSGGLLDCATAGLPAVANESLGAAVGVPDYVRCIPDALSPLLLAEALADLLESGLAANRPEAARRVYSAQRSFDVYARGLCEVLALEAPMPIRLSRAPANPRLSGSIGGHMATHSLPQDRELLQKKINALPWHHQIDFGDGLLTPGNGKIDVMLAQADAYFRDGITGQTFLDIGCWDGFNSFEAHRRGASRVLATDHFAWSENCWGKREAFELARSYIAPSVEVMDIDLPELTPERVGRFDVVLFAGVFYHLRHPFLILENLSKLAAHTFILETHLDALDQDRPMMVFYPGKELADDPTNWWGPNPACVIAMLRDVGFARVEYRQHPRYHNRGIFHAYRK